MSSVSDFIIHLLWTALWVTVFYLAWARARLVMHYHGYGQDTTQTEEKSHLAQSCHWSPWKNIFHLSTFQKENEWGCDLHSVLLLHGLLCVCVCKSGQHGQATDWLQLLKENPTLTTCDILNIWNFYINCYGYIDLKKNKQTIMWWVHQTTE